MRVRALTARILNQLVRDKRTMAIILVAPIIIMTLIYFILGTGSTTYDVAIINAPKAFENELKSMDEIDFRITHLKKADAISKIKDEKIIAAINMDDNYANVKLYMDGADNAASKQIIGAVNSSVIKIVQEKMADKSIGVMKIVQPSFHTEYIYGTADGNFFDNYGAALTGIIVFFLVFLIAGINFLTERTSGTLEKLLSTPIKRWEIICGYTAGFSILAIVQTLIVTLFCTYVIGMTVIGNLGLVVVVNVLTAICALTLGMLLSTVANSEFQMVQFIPLIIIPQIFLCGLFHLSGIWKSVSNVIPLHYTTSALTDVMLRGKGLESIGSDILVLLLFSFFFMIINVIILKKYRRV